MYTILRQEYKGDYSEGMKVICPYQTFVDKGISRNSISEGIRLLEAMGFITCESGGLGNIPSKYRFSAKWQDIKTKDEAKAIRKQVTEEKNRRKAARADAVAMTSGKP